MGVGPGPQRKSNNGVLESTAGVLQNCLPRKRTALERLHERKEI
jgi:hypothetical protein